MVDDEVVAHSVIGAAIEVHRTLGGPGLLESVYEEALCWELRAGRLSPERQTPGPILYKGHSLATSTRLDLLVERRIVVGCKAVKDWNPIVASQALTDLRLLNLKLALVINFGETLAKDGIHRMINGY
jgi:GxxExxY protein